jgi:micrococcal nuclease
MKIKIWIVIIGVAFLLIGMRSWFGQPYDSGKWDTIVQAKVVRVIDGDTAYFSTGGAEARRVTVRFIGIDTPEDTTTKEAGGPQATTFTKKFLPIGKTVWLEWDSEKYDKYGRSLAYVWLSNPIDGDDDVISEEEITHDMLNYSLVKAGHAQPMTIAPNTRYETFFLNAADLANR